MEGYEFMDNGSLNVYVVDDNTGIPLTDATVRIATDDAENTTLVESPTDSLGRLSEVELPAPPLEYSMEPGDNKPYSEYSIFVSAPGYEEVEVNGAEIFSGETAIQQISLLPVSPSEPSGAELFVIPDHTLWGDYPPKIPESEIKTTSDGGEIVLSRIVIPEYVVVHDGPPRDSRAKDYYVKY